MVGGGKIACPVETMLRALRVYGDRGAQVSILGGSFGQASTSRSYRSLQAGTWGGLCDTSALWLNTTREQGSTIQHRTASALQWSPTPSGHWLGLLSTPCRPLRAKFRTRNWQHRSGEPGQLFHLIASSTEEVPAQYRGGVHCIAPRGTV